MTVLELGKAAKAAAPALALANAEAKNRALMLIAAALKNRTAEILAVNEKDLAAAEKNGVPPHMLDRLALNEKRISDMAKGCRDVALLDDPIGRTDGMAKNENGLLIGRRRVPLGVIAIIYESRPNVTVDAAAICLKTGNAVILRGGKEAINSNIKLVEIMRNCLESAGLPADGVSLVGDTARESATALMRLRGYVDVLIPRGGAGLIQSVVENANVPVIETGVGICHVYVDDKANLDMAVEILFNAKCQRPSVCNAAETVLVAENVAAEFLPRAFAKLSEKNVEWRGCEKTLSILPQAKPATEDDFYTEYNDYILSCKIVPDMLAATEHIAKYGSSHSEAIVTENYATAMEFLDRVDSACVYVNASTRFTDGAVFGLGAEIGISTQKLHSRGPMGIEALTSIKYTIFGNGQVR